MPSVFSDTDNLLLLQLQTRRNIADRRARDQTASDGVPGDSDPDSTNRQASDIPDRWQLVPDDVTLHGWQRDCVRDWLSNGRGTVKVATGGGKTLFALAVAQALQNEVEPDLRLVIVVPTIPLMFQWRDELLRGNVPPAAVGLMGGGQSLSELSGIRILIIVLNSARKRLPDLVMHADWSRRMLLVVDECHRASAEQARRIFGSHPRYTLGLSATPETDLDDDRAPEDSAYEQSVVGQALGPIICEFTLKQSLEAGLLTPFEIWHIGLPLSPEEAREHARLSREISELRKPLQRQHARSRSKLGFLAWCQAQAKRGDGTSLDAAHFIGLANQRKRLLYRASARIDVTLQALIEANADPDTQAIVFHESIEEIEHLFLLASQRNLPAVLEHSQLPDSLRAENIEAFRTGIARSIISAKSLVEGFNVPSADLGIIAASSGSVRQRIQSLGRMLRRKTSGRTARVLVLYVQDTEDEAIYEKADWESVIGADRNRYFEWRPESGSVLSTDALTETNVAPREFRPPSWEVDVSSLSQRDPYPGQVTGRDVRVDQSGNLRSDDDSMIPVPRPLVDAILSLNPQRRARITPAGHLIVRVDTANSTDSDWHFLGTVDGRSVPMPEQSIRLRLKSKSGRRMITRKDRTGDASALGPESGGSEASGEAREVLLSWITNEESRLRQTIPDLYWDGYTVYWIDVAGERVFHPDPLAPLEFRA